MLHMVFHPVTTRCEMFDGVGSSLKMVKFLLKWMLFFGQLLHNMPQHDPIVLQDVALKC